GDLFVARAAAAVEDEVERVRSGVVLRGDLPLDLSEQFGTELDATGLVDAVHVAEGQRGDVAALLAEAQRLDGLVDVGEGRVERVVGSFVLHAVLFTADDADLDLEDGVDV